MKPHLLLPEGISPSGFFWSFSWWDDAVIPGDAVLGSCLLYPFC